MHQDKAIKAVIKLQLRFCGAAVYPDGTQKWKPKVSPENQLSLFSFSPSVVF